VTEFALVLIPLLLLLFAIFDFGRAIYAYNTITDAARAGARLAIVYQNCDSIRTRATQQALALAIPSTDVTVSFAPAGTTAFVECTGTTPPTQVSIGYIAKVTVVYHYSAATPLLSAIVGNITIQAATEIPVELACPTATVLMAQCPSFQS
jgi:Flp pilus assembly protein TadG